MKHPDRITVECTEAERGGCEGPIMGALLLVLLAILTFVRIVL